MLFASIALIGAMTAGAGNVVKGLVTSMSDVTRKTVAEERMQGAARLSIQNATVMQPTEGDCDADGMVEPLPFRDPAGKPAPVNGGLVPTDIGATLKDPWGTEYGYCAWDPGTITQNALCGTPARRLASINNPSATAIAVISAGRDRKFSSTCNNIAGSGAITLVGSQNNFVSGLGGASGSVVVNAPAGLQAGDLVILAVSHDGVTPTLPAGFTDIFYEQTGGGVDYQEYRVGYKVATGAETTFTVTGAQIWGMEVIAVAYRGVNTSTPILVQNKTRNDVPQASPFTFNTASITPTANNSRLVWFGLGNTNTWPSSDNWSLTPPAGFSMVRFSSQLQTWSPIGVADMAQATAAATGVLTAQFSHNPANGKQASTFGGIIALNCAGSCGGGGGGTDITLASGSDDIIMRYTYNDASGLSGDDLWEIKDTKPGTATIDKDIDVTGRAEFKGPLDLLNSGLILPGDSGGYICNAGTDQQLRINYTNNPALLEICDFAGGNGWVAVSMGGGGGGASVPADCTGLGSQRYNDAASGHCYWVEYNYVTRANAQSYCQANGGYLTAITSSTERSVVQNNLNIDEHMYIGINDIATEGNWIYDGGELSGTQFWSGTAGGSVVGGNYNSWGGGQPDNAGGAEDCAVLNTDEISWIDSDCTGGRPSFCEKSPTTGPGNGGIPSGLISRWSMDETSGTTIANSGGGTNLSWQGGGSVVPTTGVRAGAITFDGASKYASSGTGINTPQYTFALWAKSPTPSVVGAWTKLISNGTHFQMNWSGGYGLSCDTNNSSNWYSTPSASAFGTANTWHFLVCTHDGSKFRMYVDGVLAGTATGIMAGTSGSFGVGGDGSEYFAGSIDDVMVFNRALTQAEITSLYNASDLDRGDDPLPTGMSAFTPDPLTFLSHPKSPQCSAAAAGPPKRTGVSDTTNYYNFLAKWKDDYLIAAGGTSGVSAFRRNGDGTVTRITTVSSGGGNSSAGIATDDNYIYVNNYSHNLVAFTFNGTTLTQVGSINTPSNGTGVTKHKNYVVTGDSNAVLAYTFNGSTFTQVGSYSLAGASQVWSDGTYIYALSSTAATLTVLTFDGTNFALVTSATLPTGVGDNMTGDGKYLYVATVGAAVEIYKFDGTTLTLIDAIQTGLYTIPAIATDGVNFFMAEGNMRLYVGRMERDRIRVVSTYNLNGVGGNAWDILSDGSYLYVATNNGAMQVYSGTGCYGDSSAPDGLPAPPANTALEKISVGPTSACGIKRGGSVWCWGSDSDGQLGNGATTGNQVSPSRVDDFPAYVQVSVGTNFACGVRSNGVGTCWGDDYNGRLGNGAPTVDQPSPNVIATYKWTKISAGADHACGIRDTGQLYCWGYNGSGQLGTGNTTSVNVPTEITLTSERWTDVTAGNASSCAVTVNGNAYCWGDNGSNQLGVGSRGLSTASYTNPQLVADAGPWLRVAAGDDTTCGIKTDGTLWCWGFSLHGVGGTGSAYNTYYDLPGRVADRGPWTRITITRSVDSQTACGIKQNGMAMCWGVDRTGVLGNTAITTADFSAPINVVDPGPWSEISVGDGAACGMKLDGTAWCWGADTAGRLGNGATLTAQQDEPSLVANFIDVPSWNWDTYGQSITASGTAHIGLGTGLSYDGFQSPVTNNPDGLEFSSTAGRSFLRKHTSGSELLLDATATNGAAQISWNAASAANVRSLGIDYTSGSLELGNNIAGATNWMYQITPALEVTDVGTVGIGTNAATVRSKLEVNGGLRISNDTGNCNIMRKGTVRYIGTGNVFEYCDGAAWSGL